MGILAYWKIGLLLLVVAIFGAGSGYIHHLRAENAGLEAKVREQADVIRALEKAKEALERQNASDQKEFLDALRRCQKISQWTTVLRPTDKCHEVDPDRFSGVARDLNDLNGLQWEKTVNPGKVQSPAVAPRVDPRGPGGGKK